MKGDNLRTRGGRCPLEFVAGVRRPHDYEEAAQRLDISGHDMQLIVGAADNFDRTHATEQALRRQLLRACGIKPEPAA